MAEGNFDSAEARPGGVIASLRRLLATFVELVQTRVEIVSTELEEERERLRQLVFYAAMAMFFAGVGLLLLTLFVVLAFWETHRLAVLGGFGLAYLGIGVIAAIAWRSKTRARPRMFSATLSELAKDREQLTSRS